jgi:GAF domain-containing protein
MAELDLASSTGDRFAAVARSLRAQPNELQTVGTALAAAVDLIDGCQHAGISMLRHGRIETPAATSAVALRGDELQYQLKEGPCLDSIATEETVLSTDLLQEPRWPNWAPQVARELGVRSMLCFQLFISEKSLGALNLYSEEIDAFDQHDRAVGLALAAHIAVALAASREIDTRDVAIVSRTIIGQAEGILMERYDLTAEKAFAVLKRVSQESQTKLATVAADLVRTRIVPVFPAESRKPFEPQPG